MLTVAGVLEADVEPELDPDEVDPEPEADPEPEVDPEPEDEPVADPSEPELAAVPASSDDAELVSELPLEELVPLEEVGVPEAEVWADVTAAPAEAVFRERAGS